MMTKIYWELINLSPEKTKQMERLRKVYQAVDQILIGLYADPRLMAIARTDLETSLMAANKSIAVHNVTGDKEPHDETTE